MTAEDVRANYNRVGIDVIEMMYSDGYLSIGGDESTDLLADAARINVGHQVLDIGCGLGGPALHLASSRQCHVTGLDLVELNVVAARERAAARALAELTTFEIGDATTLPFRDGAFDVVWGQDAWCHIDDKHALIDECMRVLRPGGSIAFTDWVVASANMDSDLSEVLEAAASAQMIRAEDYRRLLGTYDVKLAVDEDISATFLQQYRNIMAGLVELEPEICARFSPKVFAIIAEKNGAILRGFERGLIGGVRMSGIKPGLN